MMILPVEWLQAKPQPRSRYVAGTTLKRVIDFTLASVGLLVLLPFFAIVAAVIKLDSRGPIFYTQERIGLNRRRSRRAISQDPADRRKLDAFGRPFTICKFRTMIVDAESGTGPVWADEFDSRITRVGRILRKTRIDEFPQFWNVIRGEMSLVGPRPERPSFVQSLAKSIPDYPKRCSALPGITGLAQVKWHYDSSIETVSRKLQYDLYYVNHGRLLLDLKIMAATVSVMARGNGAR